MPPFMDFRLIPGSAESFQNGFEPSVENPYDPEYRIFNYPAFWRLFFYTGITQTDTIWISVLMLALFFTGLLLFPKQLTTAQAAWMLVTIFSPASMLLYERGNTDLIVFFICALIVWSTTYSTYGAAVLIAIGTIIKLFPFFGITVFLKEQRRTFWLVVAGCFLVLAIYMVLAASSVNASWSLTMRGVEISYGANTLFRRYELPMLDWLQTYFRPGTAEAVLRFVPILVAMLMLLFVAIRALKYPSRVDVGEVRHVAAFRIGASIYVGTYLLGNNWDYRLAFLIFVVPQLAEWMSALPLEIRSAARLGMVCLILTCWHFIAWYSPVIGSNFVLLETTFILDEFINWTLMIALTYLLVVSLPVWMKADLKRLLPERRLVSST